MEIEVIDEKKTELIFKIDEKKHKSDKKSEKASAEYHSLCNVLRKYLMEDEDVVYAVYGYDHPLTGFPVMTIKTKKTKRPRDSLLRAAQRLKEETAEFKELVEENL